MKPSQASSTLLSPAILAHENTSRLSACGSRFQYCAADIVPCLWDGSGRGRAQATWGPLSSSRFNPLCLLTTLGCHYASWHIPGAPFRVKRCFSLPMTFFERITSLNGYSLSAFGCQRLVIQQPRRSRALPKIKSGFIGPQQVVPSRTDQRFLADLGK